MDYKILNSLIIYHILKNFNFIYMTKINQTLATLATLAGLAKYFYEKYNFDKFIKNYLISSYIKVSILFVLIISDVFAILCEASGSSSKIGVNSPATLSPNLRVFIYE